MTMAWGIAGLSAVCKTVRAGFDSLPRLHRYRVRWLTPWHAQWVVRDGKRLGPFLFSNDWIHIENLEWQIFHDKADLYRAKLQEYNSVYRAPENPVHLARDVIGHFRSEATRFKEEAIAARRELSKLKRGAK